MYLTVTCLFYLFTDNLGYKETHLSIKIMFLLYFYLYLSNLVC